MRRNTRKSKEIQENYEFPVGTGDLEIQLKTGAISYHAVGNHDVFEHLGVNANDILIYRHCSKVDEDQLAIWTEVDTGSYNLGFCYDNFGDITIHNKAERCARYKKKEIKLKGAVVGVIRAYNALNSDDTSLDCEESEINISCSKCKREATGDKKFLRAEGWEIKGDETICLSCDLKKGF